MERAVALKSSRAIDDAYLSGWDWSGEIAKGEEIKEVDEENSEEEKEDKKMKEMSLSEEEEEKKKKQKT